MDLINILIIAGAGIALLVLAVIVIITAVVTDVMSFTARGSTTMSPTGTSAGSALVIYSPGFTGAAKSAAATIAGDLQSKGYTVRLAGIKSADMSNVSGYDVIVTGGPMYWGQVSSSVNAYLKGLQPQKNVKLAVFAMTGWTEFNDQDIASFGKQAAALSYSGMLDKAAVTKTIRSGAAGNTDCSDFISAVLQ